MQKLEPPHIKYKFTMFFSSARGFSYSFTIFLTNIVYSIYFPQAPNHLPHISTNSSKCIPFNFRQLHMKCISCDQCTIAKMNGNIISTLPKSFLFSIPCVLLHCWTWHSTAMTTHLHNRQHATQLLKCFVNPCTTRLHACKILPLKFTNGLPPITLPPH